MGKLFGVQTLEQMLMFQLLELKFIPQIYLEVLAIAAEIILQLLMGLHLLVQMQLVLWLLFYLSTQV